MSPSQKRIFALLLLMATAVFILVALPNAAASQNMSMVQMFEPDEAAPLPAMLHMIAPAPSLDQTLRYFVFYDYYFYGFPFFASSALAVLPLQWLGHIQDLPLVMLALRQLISVLPMLAALLLLVYLQDGFRTYRSPVLFAFLLSVPAVLANDFWWHADSLTFLAVALTLFFLARDNLRFGRNFLLAAVTCAIATATKLVGADFFLAVGLALLLGFVLKKASSKKLVGAALAFLLVMAVSFVAANPFLLSHWALTAYLNTFKNQTDLLSQGYGVVYDKGLVASWPIMHPYYGEALFLLAALGVSFWGIWRGPRRLLHGLILAWFIPVSVTILYFTHFKYQYWLPAALPLFSSLVILLPEKLKVNWAALKAHLLQAIILLVVLGQFILFAVSDVQSYDVRLHRADNNDRILFYSQAVEALKPLPAGPVSVYYDYRMYLPDTLGWKTETSYDLLEYGYIQQRNFGVLLLLDQRIRDYLNPAATGIDPELFARNQKFYRDADNETIAGYHFIFRNPVGLVYVREDLYLQYFNK